MRLRDIVAVLLLVSVAIGGKLYRSDQENPPDQRRPDPRLFEPRPQDPVARGGHPPPVTGRLLAPESRNDPGLVIEESEKRQSASGTAFSINRDGVWITARHVTDGCDLVGLLKSDRRLVRVLRVAAQPDSDISILWTNGGAPALALNDPQLRIGEDGYSFGYPKGDPGDVHGQIVGRRKMISRGSRGTAEPIIAWTHVRRVPDRGADLSGISGGPWVNASGEVIGVHVAGAPRRGRSYSTAPRSLNSAIGRAQVSPRADFAELPSASALTAGGFSGFGSDLRRRLTVAKVICLVGERWRGRT